MVERERAEYKLWLLIKKGQIELWSMGVNIAHLRYLGNMCEVFIAIKRKESDNRNISLQFSTNAPV